MRASVHQIEFIQTGSGTSGGGGELLRMMTIMVVMVVWKLRTKMLMQNIKFAKWGGLVFGIVCVCTHTQRIAEAREWNGG